MSGPRTSLDQWQCFLAVVDEGGYSRAAEALHKSQSAVSYAVQKLEEQLGVAVFEIRGRKAELTATGRQLYHRGRALLAEACELEAAARIAAAGWESELRLVVDALLPREVMLDVLGVLGAEAPETRIECIEAVLSGVEEALLEQRCDLAITGIVPPGFLGDLLLRVRFVAVAHRDHPLHRLGRPLRLQDLRQHHQLVVRDSGQRRRRDEGWLDAPRRLTLGSIGMSVEAAARGLGFAWLPEIAIRDELAAGLLKPLPLSEGGERWGNLFLIVPNRDLAGPAVLRCEELLREQLRTYNGDLLNH